MPEVMTLPLMRRWAFAAGNCGVGLDRSVIGMLNYLDKGSRSDIAYATHQCARFVDNPKVEHWVIDFGSIGSNVSRQWSWESSFFTAPEP